MMTDMLLVQHQTDVFGWHAPGISSYEALRRAVEVDGDPA